MDRRILSGITLTLALAVPHSTACAQAAAESVMLNAGSSTATVKAGSKLGSALNRADKQLAERVRQTVQPAPGKTSPGGTQPVSVSPVKDTAVRSGATPPQGSMIASIQGTVTRCGPTNQTASTQGNKTAAGAPETNCSGQDSASKSAQKYKSVITLASPK